MLTWESDTGDFTEGKHLRFANKEKISPKGKTFTWAVMNKHDEILLGSIRWFSHWRCYSFYPLSDTVFEKDCLRDIADFCELETKEQKKKKLESQ